MLLEKKRRVVRRERFESEGNDGCTEAWAQDAKYIAGYFSRGHYRIQKSQQGYDDINMKRGRKRLRSISVVALRIEVIAWRNGPNEYTTYPQQ
jgi:hypothetical protein